MSYDDDHTSIIKHGGSASQSARSLSPPRSAASQLPDGVMHQLWGSSPNKTAGKRDGQGHADAVNAE